MISRLEAIGFQCTPLRFGEVDNFWAVRGNSGPLLAFAGHTDVVPTGPEAQWHTPPFEPTLVGDTLYGRGTADIRGYRGQAQEVATKCQSFIHDSFAPSCGRAVPH